MKYRIRLFREDGWEVGEPEEFEGLGEAQEQARFFLSTGEAYRAVVEKWEVEGLHGQGWYQVWWTIDDQKGIGIKEMETGKQKSGIKLSKVALGQLIQVATEKRRIEDVTPGVLAELTQAGMFEQRVPEMREDQTVEWQIKRNKEALAKLAHWAKNACPKDPFKGGPLGGKSSGYDRGSYRKHPAMEAWEQIGKIQEYKACPKTVLSEAAWEMLKGLGIEPPKKGEEGKPCGNG